VKKMKKLLTKSVAMLSLTALVLFSLTPAAYAATVTEISGNGADSDNDIEVSKTNTQTVVQSNTAIITNDIHSEAETGENEANDNTGGDVVIGTGNALSVVDVTTKVNLNRITDGFSTAEGGLGALISGNGADSENEIEYENFHDVSAYQDNLADIANYVDAEAETGENDANRNTGGDVVVVTGHAQTAVDIDNIANANLLNLGSVSPSQNGGIQDLRIIGNGADSENSIEVTRLHSLTVVQDNAAIITNDVEADAETGENDVNDNTGGDVRVDTGLAKALVNIDNLANFNHATDVHSLASTLGAKVAVNGADSESEIEFNQDNLFSIFQGGEGSGNLFDVFNRVEAEPESGENDANRNTAALVGGVFDGDPTVISGHAQSETYVRNVGNANIYGSGLPLPGGTNLELGFDLGALWSLLH
jgi:translation initiation factor 1 (eIF-1/SUI1)